MKINPLLGDVTNEIIEYIYAQMKRKNNKRKIKYVVNTLTTIIFSDIKPYLYTIVSILILIFLMNCFNFYYYIKLFTKSNPNINLNTLEI